MANAGETYLPVSVVTPILLKLIAERNYEPYENGEMMRGGKRILADEVDMDEKRWRDMLNGRQKLVSWGVVDTIITKTGNWHLWYEMPLAHYYDETNTVKLRPSTRKRTVGNCAVCEKPLRKAGNTYCLPCYKAKRQEGKPRCKCGAIIERRSSQCLACYKKSRGKADERRKKWVAGQAWQLT